MAFHINIIQLDIKSNEIPIHCILPINNTLQTIHVDESVKFEKMLHVR